MNISLEGTQLGGEVEIISSKSYAHRLLIASALTRGETTLANVNSSRDVTATIGVLRELGTRILRVEDTAYVDRIVPVSRAVVDCVESGSTLRFTIPLVCALGIETTFTGSDRLLSRPNAPLVSCLRSHGIEVDGYTFRGMLTAGEYRIDSSLSSQYVTGLMMALPLLEADSTLVLEGERVSRGYIDITLDVLRRSGIDVTEIEDGAYSIKGSQTYRLPHSEVEGDWSNSAFFLVGGANSVDGVTVRGLNKYSAQGDKAIIDILRLSGAKVVELEDGYTVYRGTPQPIDVSCQDIPDLVPILSVLCALARGDSVLRGVSRLRDKESDRLEAVIDMLSRAGVSATTDGETLVVRGRGVAKSGDYISYNDHRMAMSEAILSTFATGVSTIEGMEAINKSYSTFLRDFYHLGGECNAMDG